MTRRHATANVPPLNRRAGFTLVELLVVIFVIAILVALLVPVVMGALKAGNNAAVTSEINALGQALATFKNDKGDYPPSRILLCENGGYPVTSTAAVDSLTGTAAYRARAGATAPDITLGELARKSVQYFRKFFPKVQLSTSGAIWPAGSTEWYDFNGNGVMDAPYVLQGDECLVFFLGGIPVTGTTFGVSGFAKNPTNPFKNSVATTNRYDPYYEFKGDRLIDDDGDGIPSYLDSLGRTRLTGAAPTNFYAYFSAYGNNNYDPNDVDFNDDANDNGQKYLGVTHINSAYSDGSVIAFSPAPNPYTTDTPLDRVGTAWRPTKFQNPQSFQIISAGSDGRYGTGGWFNNAQGVNEKLPGPDDASAAWTAISGLFTGLAGYDTGLVNRQAERDNLTNFSARQLD